MTGDDVENVWRSIESEDERRVGWHVRRISRGTPHDLQAGRRMPSGAVGLLYELDSGAVPAGTEWPDGKGFRTSIELVGGGPDGRVRVVLELTGDQYRDVFASLCGDIADVVMAQHDVRAGFGAFLRRLQAWQRFMQLHADSGLSVEQIRGLFAELAVMEDLLEPILGPVQAVEAWQGRHALHDFARDGHALEVKSGGTSSDPVMRVSRLDQFDETRLGSLRVCFVVLREGADSSMSLPELVDRRRERLAIHPGALQRLEDLLVAAGYHDSRAADYAEPRLSVSEHQLYRVQGSFPRLRRDDLHDGILAGRYSVSVGSCAEHRVEIADLQPAFGGDISGDD